MTCHVTVIQLYILYAAVEAPSVLSDQHSLCSVTVCVHHTHHLCLPFLHCNYCMPKFMASHTTLRYVVRYSLAPVIQISAGYSCSSIHLLMDGWDDGQSSRGIQITGWKAESKTMRNTRGMLERLPQRLHSHWQRRKKAHRFNTHRRGR